MKKNSIALNTGRPTYTGTELNLDPARLGRILWLIMAMLVLIHSLIMGVNFLIGEPFSYFVTDLFNLDKERNFPTFFSTVILLFSAVLFALIAIFQKPLDNSSYFSWLGLSIIFLFASADEFISIHEYFNKLKEFLNTGGIFYYSWIIPYSIFVIAFVLLYGRFFFRLQPYFRHRFLLAGIVYLLGTIGMEMIGGWYADHYSKTVWPYICAVTIEESLEMAGIIILIETLLDYLTSLTDSITISFSPAKQR